MNSENKTSTQKHARHRKKSFIEKEFTLKDKAFGAPLIPIILAVSYFFCELIFKFATGSAIKTPYVWYIFFFMFPFALFVTALSTFFKNSKVNFAVLLILNFVIPLYICVQLIYTKFFEGTFLTFTDFGNAGQITEKAFRDNAIRLVLKNTHWVLLLFVPLILCILLRKTVMRPVKTTLGAKIVLIVIALIIQSLTVGKLCANKPKGVQTESTDEYIYKKSYIQGTIAERFGIMTLGRLDIKYTIVNVPSDDDSGYLNKDTKVHDYSSETVEDGENEVWYAEAGKTSTDEKIISPTKLGKDELDAVIGSAKAVESGIENMLLFEQSNGGKTTYYAAYDIGNGEYQKVRVVIPEGYNGDVSMLGYEFSYNEQERTNFGYNVMSNIDFESLIASEKNKNILKCHNYFASVEPTQKNEYTGLFKGKNLIYMTCESFCPAFVSKEKTPALYKLLNEGFVFKNYYVTDWAASTGGGEFAMATGLYALKTMKDLGNQMMPASATRGTYLPFTVGNIFKSAGYTAKSFHNHNKDLYERAKSHKLWGFDYSYIGHGLDMDYHWPSSDKEMIDASFDKYVNMQPFAVDYMTISAHGSYDAWTYLAKKNKATVDGLNYSDPVKIYIAESMELEYAMEDLLEKLESAGILEDTVIVMAPDHWPYCLTPEYHVSNEELSRFYGFTTDNTFERYHNGLVIWSGSMKEPIVIDKPCTSSDILPTVLNLFGMEYDSRLLIGSDILSTSEGIAITKHNRSWVSELGKYDASTGKFVPFDASAAIPDDYVGRINTSIKNKINFSQYIVLYDYYKVLFKEAGIKQ